MMSRYDNPGSVVLLFGGAVVASFLLILLLNAEARYRKNNKEPAIANGNIFSAMGRQIKRWIIGWEDDNSATGSPANIDSSDMSTYKTRILQSITDGNGTEGLLEHHHIRHRFKHRKKASHHIVTTTNPYTSTVPYILATDINTSDSLSAQGLHKHLEQHEQCYTTNDVLFIIGITCAVNFLFIFLIMSIVHICNRGDTSCKMEENGDLGSQSEIPLLLSTDTCEQQQSFAHHNGHMSYFYYTEGYPYGQDKDNKLHNTDLTEYSCRNANRLKCNNQRLSNAVSMDDLLITT